METYQVVDCVNGSSWAFPDRTIAMMCAAGVHVSGHEVEVVLVTERSNGALTAEPLQRLPGDGNVAQRAKLLGKLA